MHWYKQTMHVAENFRPNVHLSIVIVKPVGIWINYYIKSYMVWRDTKLYPLCKWNTTTTDKFFQVLNVDLANLLCTTTGDITVFTVKFWCRHRKLSAFLGIMKQNECFALLLVYFILSRHLLAFNFLDR